MAKTSPEYKSISTLLYEHIGGPYKAGVLQDDPIYFANGPYRFMQNGRNDNDVQWTDFQNDALRMKILMTPKHPFYECQVGENYAKAFAGSLIPAEERDLFKLEWIAMYDQIRVMGVDIKDKDGMFVLPDYEYFEDQLNKASSSESDYTFKDLREEFAFTIRRCIAFNYKETLRINSNLKPDETPISIPDRSKNRMEAITKQVDKELSGRGGK